MYLKSDLLINLQNKPWKSEDVIGDIKLIPTGDIFEINYCNNLEANDNWDKSDNPDSFTIYVKYSSEAIGNLSLNNLSEVSDLILAYVNKDEELMSGSVITLNKFAWNVPIKNKLQKWIVIDFKNTLNDHYYQIQTIRSKNLKKYWINSFCISEVIKKIRK